VSLSARLVLQIRKYYGNAVPLADANSVGSGSNPTGWPLDGPPHLCSLDFGYHIFAFVWVLRVCDTFMGILSQDIGSMDASSAMVAHSKAFVVARNKHVVPKQRRIERLTAGYAVQEFRDDAQGRYWYVVTALEVVADQ